jgi:hypothetical protein
MTPETTRDRRSLDRLARATCKSRVLTLSIHLMRMAQPLVGYYLLVSSIASSLSSQLFVNDDDDDDDFILFHSILFTSILFNSFLLLFDSADVSDLSRCI